MQSVIKAIEQSPINKLQMITVLLAMLIAAQMQYIQHGWINPDSVLYFESARLIANWQWKEAFNVWNWPLYPILIAATHKITSLGIQTSAQVLNVSFFGLTAFSFTQIIRLASGGNLTVATGALILFSSQYIVGDVLEMLMRDEGFWAFYLTGIVFFIRFYQHLRFRDAMLWQLCAIIATLFRMEAITYLVLLPFMFIFSFNITFRERVHYLLVSHALNIFLAVALILAIALNGDLSIKNFGRLQEVFTLNLYDELTGKLFTQASVMSNEVLGRYLSEFAVQGLLLTFIYVLIVKSLSTTGLINIIMAFFTIKNRANLIESKAYFVLSYIALISLINMALIITKVFVLSSRYVVGLSFILMVLASFQFSKILKNHANSSEKISKSKWLAYLLVTFMILSLVKNVLPKSEGYNYMQDATTWIKKNNVNNKPVFFDEPRLRYYAGVPFIGKWDDEWNAVVTAIEDGSINNYEFLVINHSAKHPEREITISNKLPRYQEIHRVNATKAKKSIVIYQKDSSH